MHALHSYVCQGSIMYNSGQFKKTNDILKMEYQEWLYLI